MREKWLHGYIVKLLIVIALAGIFFLTMQPFNHLTIVSADEYDELGKKIEELKRALQMSQSATTPLEATLKKLEGDIADIRQRIANLEGEVKKKEQEVAEGEKALEVQQKLLETRVRSLYKKNSLQPKAYSLQLLFAKNLSETIRLIGYQKSLVGEDKKIITEVVLYIKDLEEKKTQLQGEKVRLASAKEEIDKQAEFFRKEIKGAREYQVELSKKIAELTVKQQEILAQKLASLNLPTSLGAGPLYCTDDRKLDPGFSPAFAFYTFGIPHRVGMNQYGAYGRANAGQSYQDILRAYYEGINFEKRPNSNIKVQGYGEMSLEQYLLGVYEMPESWPIEALKAQVVAARSYALAYTDNGAKEICTSQKCQVYKGGNKGGNWEAAVKATEGEVMVSSGQVITAWYASTAGGYTFTSADVGWNNRPWTKRMRDTNGEINSFSDLLEKAYDKDSPCFYAAQGFRGEYGKSAWLKPNEVVDIVNVLLLAKSDSSTQKHLPQVDKPNPDGVETWDAERVKQELRSRGIIAYNNISDFSLDWDKSLGKTATVKVSGDAGSNSFEGAEFKNFFNLRAPANIQIVGPLFNIEKK